MAETKVTDRTRATEMAAKEATAAVLLAAMVNKVILKAITLLSTSNLRRSGRLWQVGRLRRLPRQQLRE